MYRVGITGGIGSGKTLVCSVLEKLGVPVYYADSEARRLMNKDPELRENIRGLLGQEAYGVEGLDRAFVAAKVFGDPESLSALNKIVHPAVRKDFDGWAERQKGSAYVVEEAALLFESGAYRHLDFTILVYAPEELRLRRVMDRDGVDEKEVRKRMGSQMPEEEKKKLADEILVNDENSLLLPRIIEVHNRILKN